jgi:hypothetical protein
MQLLDLLDAIAKVCSGLKLPYYITGSVASSYYGEYRSTQDVDVVIELPSWHVAAFCDAFPEPEWYVSREAAMDAARGPGMFNIVHPGSGLKIDVMVFKDTPFDESRLSRARLVHPEGASPVMMAAPEDIILKKLEFYREGGSDKHTRDIASMFRVSGEQIDLTYIEKWVPRIGVQREWAMIKERLGLP